MKNSARFSALLTTVTLSLGTLLSSAAYAADTAGAPIATAQERSQITAGLTQEQVGKILGKPAGVMRYARSAQTSWVYVATDTVISKDAQYYVNFGQDGKVVSTQVIEPGTN